MSGQFVENLILKTKKRGVVHKEKTERGTGKGRREKNFPLERKADHVTRRDLVARSVRHLLVSLT